MSDANGNKVSLQDFRGKYVVLYVQPRRSDPSTVDAVKGFVKHYDEFKGLNTEVLGCGVDSKEDMKRFADEHAVNYPVLVDEDHKLVESFGCIHKQHLVRATFVLDKEGKVRKYWEQPIHHIHNHAKEVLKYIEEECKD